MSKRKDQMNSLGAMLAAMLGGQMGAAKMVVITPKDGQTLEEAIEEHEAEHRKTCEGCAAEHAAAQERDALVAKAKANVSPGPTPEYAAELAARAKADAAKETAVPGAQTDGVGANPARKHIGYMVATFIGGSSVRYIGGSFNTEREPIEERLAEFRAMLPIDQLNAVASQLGAPLIEVKIVPVYAD